MGLWIDVVRGAAAVNVLLLLGLCAIWGRNYLDLRSKHTLGLLVFGSLLLAENLLALWVFGFDPVLSDWFASESNMPSQSWHTPGNAMMALKVAESAALVFLGWVTMD